MIETGLPLQRNFFMRWLGAMVLKSMGWKIEGVFPSIAKAVLIAAPHTSNWDFVVGAAAKFYLQLKISWLGKHTLFRKPFDSFFRWMGGIPVQRNGSHGVVEQSVERFAAHEQFLLALSPEGTRKKVQRWKTGFYRIAKGAGVSIIPVAFDYATKRILIGEPLHPSDSMERDFQTLQDFYSNTRGKHPEKFSYKFLEPL
jgi:1-acyl-sn-glycerol-3-phosphate acyltransferase